MDTFAGARRLTRMEEADLAVRELLQTLLGNREMLLACLLSGKTAFQNECRQAFAGMLVTEDMLDHIWAFLQAKRGPGNIIEEYEWLLAQKEVQENAARAEAAALKELAEKAHGKDAEAERGKFGPEYEHGMGL